MISFLVSATLMLSTCMVYAGDLCQVIELKDEVVAGVPSVQISPDKITVPVGTCTVWINFVRYAVVQVAFRENAKECVLSTEAATGFQEQQLKTPEVCNISNVLGRGQTASLLWSKPGIYKYTIETQVPKGKDSFENISVEGVIEVK